MGKIARYLVFLLVAVSALLVAEKHGEHVGRLKAKLKPNDTVFVEKKVFVDKPQPTSVTFKEYLPRYVFLTDTVAIIQHSDDTTSHVVSDTVKIVDVPIEEKVYEGEGYKACVSGYAPRLEWMELTSRDVYITPTETSPKRWNISVSVGYGMGKNGLTPIFAITGGYTLFSF